MSNVTPTLQAPAHGTRHPVVLVAEDSQEQRAILVAWLRQAGFDTCEAANGTDAQQMLAHLHVDCALLDVVMPGVDGYKLCRRLRDAHVVRRIPVVLMSAKTQPIDKKWGLQQGASAYLFKPFTQVDLVATIRAAIAR